MMTDRFGDERLGAGEVAEFPLGQKDIPPVIGQQHSLIAHEQKPLSHLGIAPPFAMAQAFFALVPMHLDRRQVAAGRIHTLHASRRCDFRMRMWAEGLDRAPVPGAESPEWQIIPVASQVAHGAITKVPPSIPLGTGEVDFVERPCGCGAKP